MPTKVTKMGSKIGLCSLPAELLELIIPKLDPSAAIALRQTSRWFNTYVSLHRLDRVEVRKYLHCLELQPQHKNDYACYSCLCLKHVTSFTDTQTGTAYSWNGIYSTKRFCLDCGVKNGKFKPESLLYIAGEKYAGSTPAVLCGGCLSIQVYFCADCHRCIGCITKARTWDHKKDCKKILSSRFIPSVLLNLLLRLIYLANLALTAIVTNFATRFRP